MTISSRFLYWLPAAGWAGFIFFLSTLSFDQLPPSGFLINDKIVHATLFGVMSLTVYFALRKGHRAAPWLAALAGFLIASGYGGSDEVHQFWTPHRCPDWADWLADMAGAACVFPLALLPFRHDPAG